MRGRSGILILVLIGAALGGAAADYLVRTRGTSTPNAQGVDLQALQADVERLESLLPNQSHIMMDVGYHWTNLWVAAQQKNSPLARFMFSEAKQHIAWTASPVA